MVMYGEFETKENKIQTKDKIEPQFQYGEEVRGENNNNNNFILLSKFWLFKVITIINKICKTIK